MSERMPILHSTRIVSIPMAMLIPHEAQAIANHGGTLSEIKAGKATAPGNRGWPGLTVVEALWILKDQPLFAPVRKDVERVLEDELIAMAAFRGGVEMCGARRRK